RASPRTACAVEFGDEAAVDSFECTASKWRTYIMELHNKRSVSGARCGGHRTPPSSARPVKRLTSGTRHTNTVRAPILRGPRHLLGNFERRVRIATVVTHCGPPNVLNNNSQEPKK